MATPTVTELVTTTLVVTSSTPSSTSRAPSQGGILDGADPSKFDPKNPITHFIIQASIIIIFCRLLHWPLSKLRQPRVIAEVIGGILLGPSVMGRIPGFQDAIFPTESMPVLTNVANLGLVLFLFLVGLEVDLRFLVSNWKVALSVGAAGMALPFGLGAAIAWGLYNEFRNEPGTVPISFGVYLLFIGVAMAITAFPVLCRILTELKLLGTPVGIIVLSAGVGNDVVGWILLALCVALVNAGTGLTALWVLLTCVGFTLFLVYLVRLAFIWVLRKTRSLQDGPSQGVVALTLLLVLASSFFTSIIGIHAIFGAFMVGLICPHEGGFAIKLTEKIEDLVTALFLPLYFALSGLSTDLALLDNGITWAYVVGVICVAFFAKIIGGSGAARLNGMVWRECFTIGALMSCKGLVELIVLNIGLQAKILSTRTFTIFVVMALVTTFATTPLVSALYPPWYQKKLEAWKRGEIDWDTGKSLVDDDTDSGDEAIENKSSHLRKLLIYLRIDTMPGLLTFVSIFGGANECDRQRIVAKDSSAVGKGKEKPITVHGIRMVQLTERESSVMKVSEVGEYSTFDPVVNTFRAFGRLHNVPVSGEVAVLPENYYADTLNSRATELSSDLILLPWSETGSIGESQTFSSQDVTVQNKMASGPFKDFVGSILREAQTTVALFVNNNFGGAMRLPEPRKLSRTYSAMSIRSNHDADITPIVNQSHNIFMPYFGSVDDKKAVQLVLQLAKDPRVTATIVHFKSASSDAETASDDGKSDSEELQLSYPMSPLSPIASTQSATVPVNEIEAKGPVSQTVERITLQERHAAYLSALKSSLSDDIASRVTIDTVTTDNVGSEVLERIEAEVGNNKNNAGDLVVVGRNSSNEDSDLALGMTGNIVMKRQIRASLVVVQAPRRLKST